MQLMEIDMENKTSFFIKIEISLMLGKKSDAIKFLALKPLN